MIKEQIIREVEREIEYMSPHTQRQYRAHIGDYLDFVGNREWQDRDVLYNYQKKLRERRHLSQSHIIYLLRGPVGCLFRAHGLDLPIKMPKFRGFQVDLTERVTFDVPEVEALINATRQTDNSQWQAFMALSTTFGLRASELRQLRPQDVKKATIMIWTLKEGQPREHLLPHQIASYIHDYDYPVVSEGYMFILFDAIRLRAGIERQPRKSWHAIRHAVATQLVLAPNGPKERVIYNFLRWKMMGQIGVYYTPKAFEEDELIYPIHPFLKYWE